jgi:hypothetical protein
MAENEATRHADGRLRIRAQPGAVQYDPRLVVRTCPECEKPGVLSGGLCVPCRIRAGLSVPRFTRPRNG